MGLGNPRANRQSKARALLRMGARDIGAIEPVEDLGLIFLCNPNPVIGHRYSRLSLVDRQRYIDGAAGTRVLDGIIEQIQEQLAQTEFVSQDHD